MARFGFAILALVLMLPWTAKAEEVEAARFDLRFGPLRVAGITLQARQNEHSYSAAGRVTSAGLAGAFREIRFDLAARGALTVNGRAPYSYTEDVDTGRRQSQVHLLYDGGVPIIERLAPERPVEPWDIQAADQRGRIDPLTALVHIAWPAPETDLCGWSAELFDGRRQSQVFLSPATREGNSITCSGIYRRIAGFSPQEMQERAVFPFLITYQPRGDGVWQLTRIDAETLYGQVRILRRD